MAGINQMAGTPWHVEKMTRSEGDDRRHRSRCEFYSKKTKCCSKTCGSCYGASHCPHYKENETIILNDDSSVTPKEKTNIEVASFEGIKMVSISMIKVDANKFKKPSVEKINEVANYVKTHGTIDKPISVSCKGSIYWLEDKYLRYYVAKQEGLKEVPIKISTEKQNHKIDRLWRVGTKLKHKTLGEGIVSESTEKYIIVKFKSGVEKKMNVEFLVMNDLVSIM